MLLKKTLNCVKQCPKPVERGVVEASFEEFTLAAAQPDNRNNRAIK